MVDVWSELPKGESAVMHLNTPEIPGRNWIQEGNAQIYSRSWILGLALILKSVPVAVLAYTCFNIMRISIFCVYIEIRSEVLALLLHSLGSVVLS